MNLLILAVLFVGVIVANYALRFDVDSRETGTPPRPILAKAAYPKSYLHALQAFALMAVAVWWADAPWIPAALVIFAGLLVFEWTQRFIDWIDVAANAAGIALAILFIHTA